MKGRPHRAAPTWADLVGATLCGCPSVGVVALFDRGLLDRSFPDKRRRANPSGPPALPFPPFHAVTGETLLLKIPLRGYDPAPCGPFARSPSPRGWPGMPKTVLADPWPGRPWKEPLGADKRSARADLSISKIRANFAFRVVSRRFFSNRPYRRCSLVVWPPGCEVKILSRPLGRKSFHPGGRQRERRSSTCAVARHSTVSAAP